MVVPVGADTSIDQDVVARRAVDLLPPDGDGQRTKGVVQAEPVLVVWKKMDG